MTEFNARVESGVSFPDHPDTKVQVEGTFIESGNQLQQVFIGLQPVIVIQPEYDSETDTVNLLLTTVDLPPEGLLQVLDSLRDATEMMVKQQEEMAAEQAAADEALRKADRDFELAQLPETPEG